MSLLSATGEALPGTPCPNCLRTLEEATEADRWAQAWSHGTFTAAIVGRDICNTCKMWLRFRLSRARYWCQLLEYWCTLGIGTEDPIERGTVPRGAGTA